VTSAGQTIVPTFWPLCLALQVSLPDAFLGPRDCYLPVLLGIGEPRIDQRSDYPLFRRGVELLHKAVWFSSLSKLWASWTNCLNPSEMGVPSQRVGELRLAALSCSPQGQATSRVLRGSDVSHSAYAADEESEGASLAIAMRRRGRCHTGRTCASRVASELSLCVRDGAGDRRQVKQNGRQCLPNVESKSGVL
jgi:hypothetical protein